jgi:hypothetical protein
MFHIYFQEDIEAGYIPIMACATVGTTSTAAVDPLVTVCGQWVYLAFSSVLLPLILLPTDRLELYAKNTMCGFTSMVPMQVIFYHNKQIK